jgi:hypothetical protein
VTTKIFAALAIVLAAIWAVLFVPSPLYSKHFNNNYNGQAFYCGRDVQVWSSEDSLELRVRYVHYANGSEAGEREIKLNYTGSALVSDYYAAKTGEQAEYDGELKLSGFGNDIGGTCY